MPLLQAIDVAQFALLLAHSPPQRRIDAVHLHHTGNPSHAQWRGRASLEAMREVHVNERGLPDFAQHLTIDPLGHLWLGRDWDEPPASCCLPAGSLSNGDNGAGPFMIVLAGNFDDRHDTLVGAQRQALIETIALLTRHAATTGTASLPIVTHSQLDTGTTCPGTGITAQSNGGLLIDSLLTRIEKETAALPKAPSPLPDRALPPLMRDLVRARRERVAARKPGPSWNWQEIPEDHAARTAAAERARRLAGVSDASRDAIDPRYAPLFGHVLNTARGLLLESPAQSEKAGNFYTSQDELAQGYFAKLDAFERKLLPNEPLHLMLHAPGGLVSETASLDYALAHREWWLESLRVFPFFMTWETGFFETLLQSKRGVDDEPGSRGIFDWIIEKSTAPVARRLWDRMKANAKLCAARDWHATFRDLDDDAPPAYVPQGVAGGGHLFALALCDRLAKYTAGKSTRKIHLHAVGHSAGAVYHAHFLPMLLEALGERKLLDKVNIDTLHLFAPAVRVDTFEVLLAPILGKGIERTYLYTMDDKRERDDDVAFVYRKSLLYFVDEACERNNPGLLGMARYLERRRKNKDTETARVFPPVGDRPGQVDYSDGRKPAITASTTHGGFDNDTSTMESVARRILGVEALQPHQRYEGWIPRRPRDTFAAEATRLAPRRGAGRRLALCIGIDKYPTAPLDGCVNDSRAWGGALQSLGFTVDYLHDEAATLGGMKARIGAFVRGARPGDALVLQVASHGTTFADSSGDETDGYDQALVPIDFRDSGCLLDDDLYVLLQDLPQGVDLTIFLDCCHSRSASRFGPAARSAERRARYLPADPQMIATQARARAGAPRVTRAPGTLRWLHVAACQDTEYAYETRGSGDFTRCAVPLLTRADAGGWNAQAFIDEVRRAFPPGGRQNPDLMPGCDAQRSVLPGGRAPADRGARGIADPGETGALARLLEHATAELRARTRS